MKTIFANEAEVPESLKAKAVKQEDGTYLFEGDGLVKKNNELLVELTQAKKLSALLKGLDTENLTPEKIKAAITDMETSDQREQQIQSRIQAAVEENSRKLADKVKASSDQVISMQSSLEKHLIDSELTRAIAAEDGDARFVAPILRSRVKVIKQDTGDYATRILNDKGEIALDDKGSPRDVLSLVKEAKADKAFAAVFKAPAASGSGTPTIPAKSGEAGTGPGLAVGTDGRILLTREQAKDHMVYRQAVELVKGDSSKVSIAPPTSQLQPTGA